MDKKLILGGVAVLTLLGGGGFLMSSLLKQPAQQQVTDFKTPTGKSTTSESSTEPVNLVIEEPDTEVEDVDSEDTDTNDESETAPKDEEGFTISGHKDDIVKVVKKLNNFKNATATHKQKVIDELARYNVSVDPSVTGPFGLYDALNGNENDQSLVMAGAIVDENLTEEGNEYKLTLQVRTGQSPIYNDVDFTGSAIVESILEDGFDGETKEVVYVIQKSEDDKSATLVQRSGQWW